MRSLLVVVLWGAGVFASAEDLPNYQPAADLTGAIESVGSDTMGPLVNSWAAAFSKAHPDIRFAIEARGSGTGPGPLTEGASDIAPMSREMSAGEKAAFEARHGYLPTQIRVGLDAVAVYVNTANPLESLTLEQVDGIFSQSRDCGGDPILFWDQLDAADAPQSRIKIVGRNRISGTFEFFREHALCGGEFRDDYDDQEDSLGVVWQVANNKDAIGFAGIGYRTPAVKVLQLARTARSPAIGLGVTPDGQTDTSGISDGRYPLARFIHIYVNKKPGEALPERVEAFIRFVLSTEGQEVVSRRWFIPVNARTARSELAKLEPAYQPSWFE